MEVASKWLMFLVISARAIAELFQGRSERPSTLLEVPPSVIVNHFLCSYTKEQGRQELEALFLRPLAPGCRLCGTCAARLVQFSCSRYLAKAALVPSATSFQRALVPFGPSGAEIF